MGLEIWFRKDIENILWATQAVIQATATASGNSGRSIGYDQGFKSAIEHITRSFTTKVSPQEIWSFGDIEETLSMIRLVALSNTATPEDQSRPMGYDRGFSEGLEVALWCIATSLGVNLLSPRNGTLPTRTHLPNPDACPLWFGEDLRNILLAIQEAILATIAVLRGQSQAVEYNQGFEAALRCVAEAFGVRLLTESDLSLATTAPSFATHFWLSQGIEHKLLTIHQAAQDTKATSENNGASALYWQGFETALRCIGTSFGVAMS